MQKAISLKLLPEEAATDNIIKAYIAGSIGNKPEDISGFIITKKSIDARGKQAWVNLTLTAYINEPVHHREKFAFHFQDIHKAEKSVIIIGAGRAG